MSWRFTRKHVVVYPAAQLKQHLPSLRRGCGAALVMGMLVSFVAQAAGPTEPVGPVGPMGAVGATGRLEPGAPVRAHKVVPGQRAAVPTPPPARADGSSAARGNRIEVSGNTASGVQCGEQGAASVNSVDIQGARLEGQTVIVQGRNARDVRGRDCAARADPPRDGSNAAAQTNSIRIR